MTLALQNPENFVQQILPLGFTTPLKFIHLHKYIWHYRSEYQKWQKLTTKKNH